MRIMQWMMAGIAVLAVTIGNSSVQAQPGHAPFTFGALEIEDYERTLAPAGIAGATIVNPSLVPGASHPNVIANGNVATSFQTGAPIFLDRVQSAWQQYGGILGNTSGGGGVTPTNYNDLFPGGTSVSPSGYPNGGPGRNQPNTPASYNGTKLSLVTRTDANTQDDVAITSGNQALRVQMLNKGQGDGDTSFDRPAMLVIKENDFWGVSDSRFQTWEMVRENPVDFSISVDVTILADEIPDVSATGGGFGPYLRLGFISGHGGNFDEGPPNLLQGPDALLFSNGDADNDTLPNFSDPQFVDPGNTVGLPGRNVPGVIQRRYVFPASAMTFPGASLAGIPDPGNRADAGAGNAYMFGFVFNGIWQLDTYASFFIDNIRVVDGFPTESADFNVDGLVNAADWQILRSNLNSLTANTFAQGDIGSKIGEPGISPGVVDFQDFVRFEAIYNKKNGGDGAFQLMLASVPEPSSIVLVLAGLGALLCGRRRPSRRLAALLAAATLALWTTSASAALTNSLLFSFEPGSTPDTLQRWVPAQTAGVNNATILVQATGATQGTNALKITQTLAPTTGTFINAAGVSIFGSESGLPPQAAALDSALDIGADHFQLDMDVTFRDADVPAGTSYIALGIGLSVGSDTNDLVSNVFISDGATNQTVPISIPLSIAPVDFNDTVLSVTPQQGGSYNLSVQLDGDWTGSASVYVDNVRLTQISQPPLLTLEINTATGLGTIKNTPGVDAGTGDVIFDYYEIRSENTAQPADFNADGTVNAADYTVWRDNQGLTGAAQADGDANGDGTVNAADYTAWRTAFGQTAGGNGTSLNPAGWSSLDDQNVDPNGVAVTDNWAEGAPSSTILSEARLIGSSTWNNAESRAIGNIYTPGAPHNISFLYREPSRRSFLRAGIVTYVGGPGAGGVSAVPEPGTFVLASIVGLVAVGSRRRNS